MSLESRKTDEKMGRVSRNMEDWMIWNKQTIVCKNKISYAIINSNVYVKCINEYVKSFGIVKKN